jgi:plasmid maintenance system antidote protein VapI
MKNYIKPPSFDMTSFFDEVAKNTPKESIIFIEKSLEISNCISEILERKGLMQKDLAEMLDKSEAEVSKWLCGTHNFTLQTISKIEAALGESIMVIPSRSKQVSATKTFKAPKRKAQAELAL